MSKNKFYLKPEIKVYNINVEYPILEVTVNTDDINDIEGIDGWGDDD